MRVILDSDYGPDIDDLVTHGFLHGLANQGECELIASIVSISYGKSPGAMNAVDIWHGRGNVPVGCFKGGILFPNGGGSGESDGDDWAGPIYDAYPRSVGLASTVPDGVDVYRQALADSPDGSVTVVIAGMLTVFSALLDSPGDQIDARDGVNLVAAKVAKVVVMGTKEPNSSSTEFNMRHAPEAASNVADTCPVPVWWVGFYQGYDVFTGTFDPQGSDPAAGHIVRFGLEAFNFDDTENGDGRPSWDAMAVLLAVRGAEASWTGAAGTMAISASNGGSAWAPDSGGGHVLWTRDEPASYYEQIIEPLVFNPQVVGNPQDVSFTADQSWPVVIAWQQDVPVPTYHEVYEAEVLADTPMACWPLFEDGTDIAGNHNLTIIGAINQGDAGSAGWHGWHHFDGVDDHAETAGASPFNLPGPLTYEAWLRADLSDNGEGGQVMGHDDRVGIRRAFTANRMAAQMRDGSGSDVSTEGTGTWGDVYFGASSHPGNVWTHYVVVYDRTNNQVHGYIDGMLVKTTAANGNALATDVTAPFTLGAQYAGPTSGTVRRWRQADIAWVAVYDYALPGARVQAHYAASLEEPGPLEWPAASLAQSWPVAVAWQQSASVEAAPGPEDRDAALAQTWPVAIGWQQSANVQVTPGPEDREAALAQTWPVAISWNQSAAGEVDNPQPTSLTASQTWPVAIGWQQSAAATVEAPASATVAAGQSWPVALAWQQSASLTVDNPAAVNATASHTWTVGVAWQQAASATVTSPDGATVAAAQTWPVTASWDQSAAVTVDNPQPATLTAAQTWPVIVGWTQTASVTATRPAAASIAAAQTLPVTVGWQQSTSATFAAPASTSLNAAQTWPVQIAWQQSATIVEPSARVDITVTIGAVRSMPLASVGAAQSVQQASADGPAEARATVDSSQARATVGEAEARATVSEHVQIGAA